MPVHQDIVVKTLIRHRAELISYAWMIVGDPETSEDVFQDISIAAVSKCDEIQNDEHVVGWLYQATRLQSLKARRQKHRDARLLTDEVLELLASTRSEWTSEPERISALRECINRLEGVARSVIQLRYGDNLKPAAIAERTGKNVQTVYKAITRAHKALAQCVRQRLAGGGRHE